MAPGVVELLQPFEGFRDLARGVEIRGHAGLVLLLNLLSGARAGNGGVGHVREGGKGSGEGGVKMVGEWRLGRRFLGFWGVLSGKKWVWRVDFPFEGQ